MWRTPAVAIVADHVVDLLAGRGDAGEMRGRRQRGLGQDALDGRVGALARRAAGAVGHRDEIGLERRQPRDRLPQRLLHLLGLRREELERDADAALVAGVTKRLRADGGAHHATSRAAGAASTQTGIAGEPERHRDLALRACSGARFRCSISVEAGGFHPLRHRLGGEAEPAMGMLLAQEFELVRREIDHQQPAARAQHARRLADRAGAVVEEVQHLVDDDDVEGLASAAPDRRCRPAARCSACRPGASSRARASASMSSDRSMPSPRSIAGRTIPACGRCRCRDRAASGIGCSPSALDDRRLDRLVGDMQLADAVPLGGVAGEIVLRGVGARGRAPRPAARGRARAIGSAGSSRVDQRRARTRRRRPARPGGRTPRRLRGSARPARPRPAASDGARCAAATGARCR